MDASTPTAGSRKKIWLVLLIVALLVIAGWYLSTKGMGLKGSFIESDTNIDFALASGEIKESSSPGYKRFNLYFNNQGPIGTTSSLTIKYYTGGDKDVTNSWKYFVDQDPLPITRESYSGDIMNNLLCPPSNGQQPPLPEGALLFIVDRENAFAESNEENNNLEVTFSCVGQLIKQPTPPSSEVGAKPTPSSEKATPALAAYLPLPAGTYAATKGIPGTGVAVLAKWQNGFRWYSGKIADYEKVNGVYKFDIDYDDGGKEKGVGFDQMTYLTSHPKWVTPGQKVVIYSNNSDAYWSGHVQSFNNGMVTITYDDEPTKTKTVDLSLVWVPFEE